MATLTDPFVSSDPAPDLADLLSGEDLCALCAAQGTCCCQTELAYAHLSFPLSAPEWRRLAPYASLATLASLEAQTMELLPNNAQGNSQKNENTPENARSTEITLQESLLAPLPADTPPPDQENALCSIVENTPDFLEAIQALFPHETAVINQLFPLQGKHLRMRLRDDGSCVFQGSGGCRLPRAARPWYCLLFPGWIRKNALTLFMAKTCLISRRAKSPEQGLKLLRATAGGIREMYAALRADWGMPAWGTQVKNTVACYGKK
jgi:hypothetical protein